ncbi:unnamed protein product, partial [Peniophora sp. CBMAI 1063]
MDKDLLHAIARAELAEKRLALLLTQGSPAENVPQVNDVSTLGDVEVELGNVEENVQGREPNDSDDADADISPVTVKTEIDKADSSSAQTNGDDEDTMFIGPFID